LTIDPREREKVFAYLQYIKVLYRSQQLCAHLPCDMAQSYLLDELDKLPKNEEISAIFASSNLRMRLDGQQYRNALYEKLLNVIRDEFHNKPDGRVIVFVRTREFACRLSRAFDSDQVLSGLNVRTKMITGINVSCEEGGQNANVQRDNLTDFANGKVKVLFATSVADEGIDIQKCTLVIKYNYTTNEIAHVQRRGRGRAKDSRCLLLTHDKKLKEREDQNILRERLMNMALEVIDRQSSTWFKQEV
uniref:Helicase C-terminal domain-containing protein n=1 Tax=Anisakis simplex TaxID=6269 RepID=A0A0M3J3S1_ANISI